MFGWAAQILQEKLAGGGECEFRKTLAVELVGSGKNVLGSLVRELLGRLRHGGPAELMPSPFSLRGSETVPSPPPSQPPPSFAPPLTPTLPSVVTPPVEALESVDDDPSSGVR